MGGGVPEGIDEVVVEDFDEGDDVGVVDGAE
jgi:hypothetical protein